MPTLRDNANSLLQATPRSLEDFARRIHFCLTESTEGETGVQAAAINSFNAGPTLSSTNPQQEYDQRIVEAYLMADFDAVDQNNLFAPPNTSRFDNGDGTYRTATSRQFTRRSGPHLGYVTAEDVAGYTINVYPDGPAGDFQTYQGVIASGTLQVDDYCMVWRRDVVEVAYIQELNSAGTKQAESTSLRIVDRTHWARDLSGSAGGGGGGGAPEAPVWSPYPHNQSITLPRDSSGFIQPYAYSRIVNATGSGTITYSLLPAPANPSGTYQSPNNTIRKTMSFTGVYGFGVRATDASTGLFADATWSVNAN